MKITCLLLLSLFFTSLSAQDDSNHFRDIGLEIQQYPTGYLLGLRAEWELTPHHNITLRAGYNGLDHQDFGVHESEIGGGFGGTLGYRYYFKPNAQAFFLGARADLWQNEVDWKDNIGTPGALFGTTDVWVLQPTAIAGYLFLLQDHWVFTPTLAFGAEINIKTTGAPVGEGAIVLWGLQLAYRIH